MTLTEYIARCEREIQKCRDAARAATNEGDRFGLTWAKVDWLVGKQLYEEELVAMFGEPFANKYLEKTDGFSIGS